MLIIQVELKNLDMSFDELVEKYDGKAIKLTVDRVLLDSLSIWGVASIGFLKPGGEYDDDYICLHFINAKGKCIATYPMHQFDYIRICLIEDYCSVSIYQEAS